MKNEELSASPIKKQGSAAEGKANVECRIVGFTDQKLYNLELRIVTR